MSWKTVWTSVTALDEDNTSVTRSYHTAVRSGRISEAELQASKTLVRHGTVLNYLSMALRNTAATHVIPLDVTSRSWKRERRLAKVKRGKHMLQANRDNVTGHTCHVSFSPAGAWWTMNGVCIHYTALCTGQQRKRDPR